jgi:hypothetical protein
VQPALPVLKARKAKPDQWVRKVLKAILAIPVRKVLPAQTV